MEECYHCCYCCSVRVCHVLQKTPQGGTLRLPRTQRAEPDSKNNHSYTSEFQPMSM